MTDDENPTHRWTSATDRVRSSGERITDGEKFAPTEHEKSCWPNRIEALDDGSDTSTDAVSTVRSGGSSGETTTTESDTDESE